MVKNITKLFYFAFGTSLGLILLGKPIFALIIILFFIAVCIAVIQPSLLIIGYFFYAPFQEYVRYLFPAGISIGGKLFILSGSAKEILLFLALSVFLYKKFILKIESRNKNITYYLVLLLLSWFFANIFRNESPINGFWGFRNYFYPFGFYFIGYYFIHDKKTAIRIIKACLLSGAVLTIVGLIQIFYDPNFIVSQRELMEANGIMLDSEEIGRITSLLSNPNALGKYLVVVTLFALFIFLYSHSKKEKTGIAFLLCCSVYVIFYTLSRESWLALGVGIAMMTALCMKNRKYLWLLSLAVVVVFMFYFLPSYFHERLYSISPSKGGATRIIMWKTLLNKSSNELLLGMGTGSIGSFGKLNTIILKGTEYSVSDNAYVKILIEEGIIGLMLFLILCFYIAKDIFLSLKVSDEDFPKAISIGTLLVFSSILTTAFFSESLFAWQESYIFWLIMGYIGQYISTVRKRPVFLE